MVAGRFGFMKKIMGGNANLDPKSDALKRFIEYKESGEGYVKTFKALFCCFSCFICIGIILAIILWRLIETI